MKEAYSHSMGENLVTWPHRRDAGGGHMIVRNNIIRRGKTTLYFYPAFYLNVIGFNYL